MDSAIAFREIWALEVIDKSFGFDIAVEEAQRAINAAHVEAESVENGVGVVKLMGRYSGFIAMYATLASRDLDCCLIPESPFFLEGPGVFFEFIQKRLKEIGHMVIVIAKGAGQELLFESQNAQEASGNKVLQDVGLWLSQKIKVCDWTRTMKFLGTEDYFARHQKMVMNLKHIDPTYMIRAVSSNASDNVYCTLLAHSAVHGAMAGWVEMMAPIFSREAWRCMWYMIQNGLIHAWGVDMQLGYCAQHLQAKRIQQKRLGPLILQSWRNIWIQLTRIERACAMAGLFVLRLMPEPIAVAILYGQHQQQTVHDNMGSGSENIAMIFNMGAGYCDVCVTATTGGVLQIKALSGSHIGGEDIVQNIMHHLLHNMDSLFLSHINNEMKAMGSLRVIAQDAVIKLSSQDVVMIDIDLENGLRICKVLGRPEFEEVNRKMFEKCESLVEQCVFAARVDVEDISDVILVGECSNIPKVKSLVLELCKKDEAYMGMDPLEAVVCSAALEGAVASGVSDPLGSLDLLTMQATPQSLGIEADGHTFVPIIPRNMTMPARKEMWFTITRDNQTEALIVVYEGEGKKVDENHILGYFKIMGIPSAPKGIPEISVCMDLDASNILRVFAGAVSPQTHQRVMPFLEVRMPTVDDGHGWCAEALVKMYGSALDLSIL
ncbi:hypothetical protein GIB67_010399 [Kingdonia uniflora]|uniref:Uncharacterized protein n=1 Tax=Kingdonia uniflora TaxID=39325 RepID=A0A7J7MAA7_9MAGN|nr:hypothetical protein GIB67_010399 [Kingdonia uniflora]